MEKYIFEKLIDRNFTQKQISDELGISIGAVVYWMKQYSLQTTKLGRRKSIIWTIEKHKLEKIIKDSKSLAEILRCLGYTRHLTSRLYVPLKKRIQEDSLDITHIKLGRSSNKGRSFYKHDKNTIRKVLKERKQLDSHMRQKIMDFDIIPHENCAICNQSRLWNNEKLTLQVDHVDGNSKNNDPSNLRFLCPNCHSQTETFCIGNKNIKEKNKCKDCGEQISKNAIRCGKCSQISVDRSDQMKFNIDKDELYKLVWSKPTQVIAKELGVSDVAIAKRCKRYGINKPPRGYWNKRNVGMSHEDALV